MQALMLAAGMGKRLAKYTSNNTKCMVEVAGKKLIDRAIEALLESGIKRFIIVIGYKGKNLQDYILEKYSGKMEFVFIENKDYENTNNIYSFYLAKDELVKDETILLESDIVFEHNLIKKVVDYPETNVAVVAKYESWMDGTCVTVNNDGKILSFIEKSNLEQKKLDQYFKTVNIYKLSMPFVKDYYIPFLEAYIKSYGLNSYYETTLKLLCMLPNVHLKAFFMNDMPWYEIDDAQDLDIANVLFSNGKEKYELISSKFGGFWRYSKILDFCYLVNPYFPTEKLIEKMKQEFSVLLTQYPSGEKTQNMNAERLFGVDKNHILVGNGAAELINVLGHIVKGTVGVNLPTFNEYVRCFKNAKICPIDNLKNDYSLNADDIRESIKKCDYTIIVNPDNPSGFMLSKTDIIKLCDYAKGLNKYLVIDESFADFADKEKRFTLLSNDFIDKYPNVVVIKSISKSYGIPGLRLGLLATSNELIIKELLENMQVWNINSFAEYFLQIFQLYSEDYANACDLIADERNRMACELAKIKTIKVYPSQANYLLVCLKKHSSLKLASDLLERFNILIKDLSSKDYFDNQNFIRIAVRNESDNNQIIYALQKLLSDK